MTKRSVGDEDNVLKSTIFIALRRHFPSVILLSSPSLSSSCLMSFRSTFSSDPPHRTFLLHLPVLPHRPHSDLGVLYLFHYRILPRYVALRNSRLEIARTYTHCGTLCPEAGYLNCCCCWCAARKRGGQYRRWGSGSTCDACVA